MTNLGKLVIGAQHRINRWRFAPDVNVEPVSVLKRFGSEYGEWYFRDDVSLHEATIISTRLGEDASFDVEFARIYGARVIVVEPPPRSIVHFRVT